MTSPSLSSEKAMNAEFQYVSFVNYHNGMNSHPHNRYNAGSEAARITGNFYLLKVHEHDEAVRFIRVHTS